MRSPMPRDPRAAALAAAKRHQRTEADHLRHGLKLRDVLDRSLYDCERSGWSLRQLATELGTSHTLIAKRVNRAKAKRSD
jgi:hypothetical protein